MRVDAAAPQTAPAQHKFLDRTAAVERDQLPKPLPDTGVVTDETKDMVTAMHAFYSERLLIAIPPTSPLDLGTDLETIHTIVGEHVWTTFYGGAAPEQQDAIPTQMHSVIAYQARLAMSSITAGAMGDKGDKGAGKGKKGSKLTDNHVYY